MKEIIKKYANEEITIVWQPALCIHSRICWGKANSLPEVFNPAVKLWIKPEGAATARIIEQVNHCPSGALSFYRNDTPQGESPATETEHIVEIMPNGPLLVYGNITVKHKDGEELRTHKVTAFCRCGASGNKPYCDGSHVAAGFTG